MNEKNKIIFYLKRIGYYTFKYFIIYLIIMGLWYYTAVYNFKMPYEEYLTKEYNIKQKDIDYRFVLGKRGDNITLYDKKFELLLNGKLLGYKGYTDDVDYIYFEINKAEEKQGTGYLYTVFGKSTHPKIPYFISVSSKDEIPNYAIINSDIIRTYTKKEIDKLPNYLKDKFLDLEKNKTFTFDGKDISSYGFR